MCGTWTSGAAILQRSKIFCSIIQHQPPHQQPGSQITGKNMLAMIQDLIYKMIASLGGDAKPGLVSFILSYK